MLELYQFEECLHCRKVRQRLSDWEIDYIARNVPKDLAKRTQLMKVTGQASVPALVDSGREVVVTGDEKQILDYLEQFHKKPPQTPDQSSAQDGPTGEEPDADIKGYA